MIELNKGKLEITEDEDNKSVESSKISTGQKIVIISIMILGFILSVVGLITSLSTSKVVPTHVQEEILQGEEQQVTTEVTPSIETNTEVIEETEPQAPSKQISFLFNLMRKVSTLALLVMTITMLMSIVKIVATGDTEEIHVVFAKLTFILLNMLIIFISR